MRILSYNIFNGAQAQGKDLTEAVIAIIRSVKPDIVGLCECTDFWADGAARLRHFESTLNMRSVMNRAASDENVVLLYRDGVPVVNTDVSSVTMYHGYAQVVLDLPSLGRVAVLMTHLHPRSSLLRLAEAQNILSKATFEPNALVMGDFNTLAESDTLPEVTELSPNARARLQVRHGQLDCGIVKLFVESGFLDLCAPAAIPTYPTALFNKAQKTGIRLRLDYMFATPSVAQCAEARTIDTPEAQVASDHLPLLCELEADV